MSVFHPLLRWTARVSGLLVAGGYAFLMVGEMAAPHSGSPSTFLEWTGIAVLSIAALALLIAWRWELQGALVSLAALGVQTVLIPGSPTYHRVLLTMAVPGVLYSLDWFVRRRTIQDPGSRVFK
jgi:hypothetical protein